ncbi:Uma2 family endonuclease [Actinomadura scrupuli]|uniref:Uma2 family endonuclease n=1 Tax=Actinomadura scrupuli TaxID=559629 RepID=UPI003D9A073D
MMPAVPRPRRGRYSAEDLLALPPGNEVHELIAGRLIVSPPPVPGHRTIAGRLAQLFGAAAPEGAAASCDVTLTAGADLLVPCMVVAAAAALAEGPAVDPSHVSLVAEILGPGKAQFDLLWKPGLYAAAGIGTYLQVEPLGLGRPLVEAFRLDGDGYVKVGEAVSGQRLRLDTPFPIKFDPGVLTAPGVSRTPGRARL